jgi:hypothetical protein
MKERSEGEDVIQLLMLKANVMSENDDDKVFQKSDQYSHVCVYCLSIRV